MNGAETWPVAVVGAGPVGLAAAAHLHARGRRVLVLEAGERAGAHVRSWGHVRLFSPWSELVDPAAEALLSAAGWTAPDQGGYPSGRQWAQEYLQPLADTLQAVGVEVRYGHRVVAVARRARDLVVDAGRADEPFTVQVDGPRGVERVVAGAVLDASGVVGTPNPLGADGLPALGEPAAAADGRIAYGVPDLQAPDVAARYADRHVVVAGTGASAFTVLVGLDRLAGSRPHTRVTWLVRRGTVGDTFGGGEADQLPARGALGTAARAAVDGPHARTLRAFRVCEVRPAAGGRLRLVAFDGRVVDDVDEVVAVTGYRPDLSPLSEVRLDLDPALQAPRALAPLIDPNVHSCGTVYPHGASELTQPEPGLFVVGMKSYGRAPTFLAMTGYEQVRSVAAALDGDHEAAARVELTLPETGVCGGAGLFDDPAGADDAGGCCGDTSGDLPRPSARATDGEVGGTLR